MKLEAWMLVAMEEEGILDTKEGKINRIAKFFSENDYDHVGNEEFIDACEKCDVDPYSFTSNDIDRIFEKVKK